jgi:hypothetical protein
MEKSAHIGCMEIGTMPDLLSYTLMNIPNIAKGVN